MNCRITNLIVMVSAFLLLSCESPVSERPETTSSSSEMSSSVIEVSSSSVMVSSSSVELSSSSFAIPDTIYGVDAEYPLSIFESCERWGMEPLDDSTQMRGVWNSIPDLNHYSSLSCALDTFYCHFSGISMRYELGLLKVDIDFQNYQLPSNIVLDKYIENTTKTSDSIVQATLVRGDSTYQFSLGHHFMKLKIETEGNESIFSFEMKTETSWLFQIGPLSGYGYKIQGVNKQDQPVVGFQNHYISAITGKETIYSLWNEESLPQYIYVNDTLRYFYWLGYAGKERVCGSWNGDQIRLH